MILLGVKENQYEMRNNKREISIKPKQLWEFLWDHQKYVFKEIFNDWKKLLFRLAFSILIPIFTFLIVKMVSPLILSVKSEIYKMQQKYSIDTKDIDFINENLSSIHARIDLLITILVLITIVLFF